MYLRHCQAYNLDSLRNYLMTKKGWTSFRKKLFYECLTEFLMNVWEIITVQENWLKIEKKPLWH